MIARCAWLGIAVGLALAVHGCQSQRVFRSETPEQVIAIIYHSEEEARRRAEDLSEPAAAPRDPTANRGVVDLNDLRGFFEETFGERDNRREDEGRLALLYPRTGEVVVVEAARQGATPLAWSGTRRRLLFSQLDAGGYQLFEWDRESRVVTRVTRGSNRHPQGCYGPDGRYVVVVARREPLEKDPNRTRTIFRVGITGPGGSLHDVELISPGPMDGDPTCSPDGSSVAYVRFVSRGRTEIWVHPFGQPELERRLTRGRDPSFSPDGKWIVYSQRVAGIPRLWRIRPDGAGRTRVGRVGGELRESGPSVAPDGSMLVYESVRKHRHRLFLRRLDGSGDSVLLSTGDGLHAVW